MWMPERHHHASALSGAAPKPDWPANSVQNFSRVSCVGIATNVYCVSGCAAMKTCADWRGRQRRCCSQCRSAHRPTALAASPTSNFGPSQYSLSHRGHRQKSGILFTTFSGTSKRPGSDAMMARTAAVVVVSTAAKERQVDGVKLRLDTSSSPCVNRSPSARSKP